MRIASGVLFVYRLGIETQVKETMKKKVAKLSKTEREKVEREYHRMKPEDFDEAMSAAIRRSPDSIRLSSRLVQRLKPLPNVKARLNTKQ